jgi:hypothetical protein
MKLVQQMKTYLLAAVIVGKIKFLQTFPWSSNLTMSSAQLVVGQILIYPTTTCGPGPNAVETYTAVSQLQSTFGTNLKFPSCVNYTGSLVIIPTENYALEAYTDAILDIGLVDGDFTINCTGITPNSTIGTLPGGYLTLPLTKITGSFALVGCSTASYLDLGTAVVGGDFTLADNPNLCRIRISALQNVTGSVSVNITSPEDPAILILQDLTNVGGDLAITGDIATIGFSETSFAYAHMSYSSLCWKIRRANEYFSDPLPSLKAVFGSVYINATGEGSCHPWQVYNRSGILHDGFECIGKNGGQSKSSHLSAGLVNVMAMALLVAGAIGGL